MLNKIGLLDRMFGPIAVAALLSCGALSAVADPYATAVLADGPVAYWQLNETTGTSALDSAGSFTGIYNNVVVGQPGYQAGANPTDLAAGFGSVASQSADSYVGGLALDFATNGNAVFSLEAWVNGSAQVPGAGIVGKGTGGAGEECYLDCGSGAQGAFRFFVRNAAGTAIVANSSIVPDGTWHHLVGVCDETGGTIALYVDGVRRALTSATGGIRTSVNANMNIGSRQSTTSGSYDFQFSGYISDVAVYHTALTGTQVQNHYFAAGIAPTITVQPPSSFTTNENSAVTITGAAYGSTPLSYLWFINGNPILGQTNAVFSTNSIPGSFNGGNLTLQASNAFGVASSSGTFLTIYSGAPQILTNVQPVALTLYPGSTFTYSVSAVGTAPLTYVWTKNGSPIGSATNSSYTATASAGVDTYVVTVSNNFAGGSSTQSVTATLTGATLPSGTYPLQILADHPVAYWRLGDPALSTTATEYAGGHTGTYFNTQLGVGGYSPSFDSDTAGQFGLLAAADSDMAENDNSSLGLPLIDFGTPAGSNAQFSVEAWVNGPPGQNPSGSAIVAKGISGSEEFVLDASAGSGNDFRFITRKPGTGGTAIINSSAPVDGNWHHLVGVCDEAAGTTSLYVDGNLNSQINSLGATGLFTSSTPISIGAQNSGFDYNFQFVGVIDDVSVYNYALSAAQVKAHYNAAALPPYYTSQPPTNIVAYLGQPITLSGSALGSAPLTNQWYSNSIALSGQTNASLLVDTSHVGTNTYVLKVSNAFGNTNTAGTVVQVPAGSGPPQLLTDTTPVSGSRYAGLPLTFSVVASGSTPLTYQWFSNSIAISGATNSSYSLASLQASYSAGYNVAVSNSISTIASTVSTLTVVPAPTNIYPKVVLADHPVAYFRLDEPTNSANAFDYVGGNVGQYISLTVPNFPQLGVPGYNAGLDTDTACKFGIGGTGINNTFLGNTISNIDFSQPNGQNGAFSLEAWINGTAGASQAGGGTIMAKGRGSLEEQFSIDINNGIRFYARNAAGATLLNAQAAATLTGGIVGGAYQMDGKWHHVVGICDQARSNLLMFVDGQLIGPNVITNGVVPVGVANLDIGVAGTGTNGAIAAGAGIEKPTTTADNVNTTSIGNRNKSQPAHIGIGAYDLPFLGMIDEVAFYNYALTPAQVTNHYSIGAGVRVPLNIQYINGKVVVSWNGTATLQSETTFNASWTNVPAATSPYTNNSPAAVYFRLKLH